MGFQNFQSRTPELSGHLLRPVIDDAGAEEQSAFFQQRPDRRSQTDDDVCHDVGHHQVIPGTNLRLEGGIGQNVAKQDYLDGYTGLGYPVSFTESANHADAISGATYSSRAILNGINLVLEFCSRIQAETGNTAAETDIEPAEEVTGNE